MQFVSCSCSARIRHAGRPCHRNLDPQPEWAAQGCAQKVIQGRPELSSIPRSLEGRLCTAVYGGRIRSRKLEKPHQHGRHSFLNQEVPHDSAFAGSFIPIPGSVISVLRSKHTSSSGTPAARRQLLQAQHAKEAVLVCGPKFGMTKLCFPQRPWELYRTGAPMS